MLDINNVHVQVAGDKPILRGIDLQVGPGEVHAIMGPNGSGKSTLANVLVGRTEDYTIKGSILFQGEDLCALSPEDRAVRGIFLAFQYPVAIPGVNNLYFLKTAVNSVRKARQQKELDAMDFLQKVREQLAIVGLDEQFLYRDLNEGFSGGEKKRNEILQLLMLQPQLAILDETDSGLDIDALKTVAEGINRLRSPERSVIVVTHYQRLLDYIVPDYVHVLMGGKLVKTGDKQLALELEANGYGWLSDA